MSGSGGTAGGGRRAAGGRRTRSRLGPHRRWLSSHAPLARLGFGPRLGRARGDVRGGAQRRRSRRRCARPARRTSSSPSEGAPVRRPGPRARHQRSCRGSRTRPRGRTWSRALAFRPRNGHRDGSRPSVREPQGRLAAAVDEPSGDGDEPGKDGLGHDARRWRCRRGRRSSAGGCGRGRRTGHDVLDRSRRPSEAGAWSAPPPHRAKLESWPDGQPPPTSPTATAGSWRCRR